MSEAAARAAELWTARCGLVRADRRLQYCAYCRSMEDLGPPVAYVALADGTPVYDRDQRLVGVVEHVQADLDLDIFHGLIIHTKPLPGRHLYADADQIAELHERGVVLTVQEGELLEPSGRSARSPAQGREETPLEARVRRAWDWISSHL
ncbi:MAG: hypothetical protein JWQ93_1221 [Marmoricola sp.]|nr:hypothetical protein [Marmoricola sp.]